MWTPVGLPTLTFGRTFTKGLPLYGGPLNTAGSGPDRRCCSPGGAPSSSSRTLPHNTPGVFHSPPGFSLIFPQGATGLGHIWGGGQARARSLPTFGAFGAPQNPPLFPGVPHRSNLLGATGAFRPTPLEATFRGPAFNASRVFGSDHSTFCPTHWCFTLCCVFTPWGAPPGLTFGGLFWGSNKGRQYFLTYEPTQGNGPFGGNAAGSPRFNTWAPSLDHVFNNFILANKS